MCHSYAFCHKMLESRGRGFHYLSVPDPLHFTLFFFIYTLYSTDKMSRKRTQSDFKVFCSGLKVFRRGHSFCLNSGPLLLVTPFPFPRGLKASLRYSRPPIVSLAPTLCEPLRTFPSFQVGRSKRGRRAAAVC